jgi:iron uptake system EfeUOB component EfeO/EfeM
MRVVLAGSGLLAVLSGGLFYLATVRGGVPEAADLVKVEVGEKACSPNHITVPAGRRTFEILNASSRPVEWEILQGVMVIEERENIAPGFKQTLSATLAPGDYRITCGLLSNPTGSMVVTSTAASDAVSEGLPLLKAFIGPLSEYRVFLAMQGSAFERKVTSLADAIRSGDLAKARDAYQAARLPYKQIEAIGGRFADLQTRVDGTALYLEKHEQDPAFLGFHRIEYGLYGQNSVDGLLAVAEQLASDASTMKQRLRDTRLTPDTLTGGAAMLARRLAEGRVEAGEDAYAHTDLPDFAANLSGMEKIARLLAPAMTGAALPAADELNADLQAARSVLDQFKTGEIYPAYTSITITDRARLAAAFGDLGHAFEKAGEALRLVVS